MTERMLDPKKAITKPGIKRLCKKAEIKRIEETLYVEILKELDLHLNVIIAASLVYTQDHRRKTVSVSDIRNGIEAVDHKKLT
jgi:histone H3/H4